MTQRAIGILILALGLGMAGGAAAHHPPQMEGCVVSMFTGQIERIEWRMPHVVIFVRTDEGSSERLAWLNMHQLALTGIDRDTLRVGDQVTVTATAKREEVVETPMWLTNIRRTSDGWEWSQEPQGC